MGRLFPVIAKNVNVSNRLFIIVLLYFVFRSVITAADIMFPTEDKLPVCVVYIKGHVKTSRLIFQTLSDT